jgi:NADH-quinone oxidoreductase subunit H
MDIGWKRLIPLALGWLLLIAAIRIGRNEDWNIPLVVVIGVVAGLACWALLALAMRVGADRREFAEEGSV